MSTLYFPLAATQSWEASTDTLLTNPCTTSGNYLKYSSIQEFPMMFFIQATWSQLPTSFSL